MPDSIGSGAAAAAPAELRFSRGSAEARWIVDARARGEKEEEAVQRCDLTAPATVTRDGGVSKVEKDEDDAGRETEMNLGKRSVNVSVKERARDVRQGEQRDQRENA